MNEVHGHDHDHRHNHEKHNADLNPEQLERLIPYLKNHNLDHIGDLKKWRAQTVQSGFNDIAEELTRIVELSEEIDRHFATVMEMLEKHG
ncbi:MAG TPA: hypothetical protein PKX40_08085 [Spirochaetota bacterium]|nr:hypothetical protein [Spirochaetota bacterium]